MFNLYTNCFLFVNLRFFSKFRSLINIFDQFGHSIFWYLCALLFLILHYSRQFCLDFFLCSNICLFIINLINIFTYILSLLNTIFLFQLCKLRKNTSLGWRWFYNLSSSFFVLLGGYFIRGVHKIKNWLYQFLFNILLFIVG